MNKLQKNIIIISLLFAPMFSNAQTLKDISQKIYESFVPILTNLFLTFALLFFAYGVFMFIFSEGDKKESAKARLGWATVALFVMVSFWGILRIVNSTFFKDDLGEGSYSSKDINNFKVKDGMTGRITFPE